MADGLNNRVIATLLKISPKTLDIHRAKVHRKLKGGVSAVTKTILVLRAKKFL